MKGIGLAAALLLPGVANATLLDRGHGLIYDDVLDITWLQNANLGAGSSFDDGFNTSDGRMTWQSAVDWADGLSFQGFDDWRLATFNSASPTTSAFDCSSGTAAACAASGNELGYMYYHNMGSSGVTTGTPTVDGVALNNVQSAYWSGTEFNSTNAWDFDFVNGGQFHDVKSINLAAWAVRPGDVLAAPEPTTLLLLGLGLAGLGFGRRRKRPRP